MPEQQTVPSEARDDTSVAANNIQPTTNIEPSTSAEPSSEMPTQSTTAPSNENALTTSDLTTPTTSSSGNENVSERIDDVENILKAIKTEFKDKDGLVASNESTDNGLANALDEEGKTNNRSERKLLRKYNNLTFHFVRCYLSGNNAGDKEDADKAEQSRKRQRLNSEEEAGQSTSNNLTENDTEMDNDNEVDTDNQNDPAQNWQPRRRLIRGRAFRPRGTQHSNQSTDETVTPATPPTEGNTDGNVDTDQESQQPSANEASAEATNANENEASGEGTSASAQIDGVQIPEGIDPSFLAALPEEMRAEVIAEHLR